MSDGNSRLFQEPKNWAFARLMSFSFANQNCRNPFYWKLVEPIKSIRTQNVSPSVDTPITQVINLFTTWERPAWETSPTKKFFDLKKARVKFEYTEKWSCLCLNTPDFVRFARHPSSLRSLKYTKSLSCSVSSRNFRKTLTDLVKLQRRNQSTISSSFMYLVQNLRQFIQMNWDWGGPVT